MTNETKDLKIERTFNTPVQKVWDMWTIAENFQKWYGPKGATIPTVSMDVNVGGKRLVCMEMDTPNGKIQMWLAGEYLVVSPATELSYTEVMADKDGNHLSPSAIGAPGDKSEITTVSLKFEETDSSTKMTLIHEGVPAGSPGEAGWNMAIEKLEKLIIAKS